YRETLIDRAGLLLRLENYRSVWKDQASDAVKGDDLKAVVTVKG
ncbi:1351_t:CDS:2, partial [Cetraspora pellucida]